ncbi:translation initiation factor IF-6 [Candidatus Micrarchaeota archaeon]|nr:translation initiation factor IF-6 [Candidatus Micrarchaeota archaeon]
MRTTYFGNPWIGMFIKTNDKITMLPVDSMKKLDEAIESNLKTEIIKTTIADSNLLGIYTAINSNGIILPNIVNEKEVDALKKCGLNTYISSERYNAHGNNIAVNDKGGIINPNISKKEIKEMEEVLGVELVPTTVAGHSTVGSACIATNTGFLAHYKSNENEMAVLKDALKVYGSKGTVNTGTGFVSYGIIVNKNGYVAGEHTTAFELGRLEEALGLIK